MSDLAKYMLKKGKSKEEISGALKSAGQKKEKEKLKSMSKGGPKAEGEAPDEKPSKGNHSGDMEKVANDGGKAVEKTPAEFKPHGYGKKKKPAYLD